ncbi:MAG: endonuclease/exonuclease/phosphatase family protein [Phototrophicaceae bacterium]
MLQVVTYNVGGGRKLRGVGFYKRMVQDAILTVRELIQVDQPFIIALQEAGNYTLANGERIHLAEGLADAFPNTRMFYTPELDSHIDSHPKAWGRAVYSGMRHAAEGNAILTNLAPAAWDWGQVEEGYPGYGEMAWARSTPIGRGWLYTSGTRDTQPRHLQIASLYHPQYGKLFVFNTHLSTLNEEKRHDLTHPRTQTAEAERSAQARACLEALDELRTLERLQDREARPVIFLGDFNALPHSPTLALLGEQFTRLAVTNDPEEYWTHSVHKLPIDHILVSDPRGVLPHAQARVVHDVPFADFTDHQPVCASLG